MREIVERTVLTAWGELKAAAIAALDVVREDRGLQIYSVDVERLDGLRHPGELDLVDDYGEKR